MSYRAIPLLFALSFLHSLLLPIRLPLLSWNPPCCDRIRPPRSQVAHKLIFPFPSLYLYTPHSKIPTPRSFSDPNIHSLGRHSELGSQDPAQYPTMEDIFLRCGIQWKRFFFVVGYNGRSFPPLWDTTEEVFSIVGYNGRGFFRCGIQGKKTHNTE